MKNNFQALQYAKAQLGRQYWYGTFGQLGSEKLLDEKTKQYPKMYKKWDRESFKDGYGQKVHDCIGLAVKGYMMSPAVNEPAIYNPKYDVSADQMIKLCDITGGIESMPNIPGILVWKSGHIGIYAGYHSVIEAKGHADGVIVTKDVQKWKKWGLCPWWEYISIASWLCSLYKNILNREPEPEGMAYWTQQLNSKAQTPSQVLRFFLSSPELEERHLDNKDFVTILYRVFFDREPDDEGLAYWCDQIVETSRAEVVEGLLYSQEWRDMEAYLEYII